MSDSERPVRVAHSLRYDSSVSFIFVSRLRRGGFQDGGGHYDSSNLCVFDEVQALLARLVCHVESCSFTCSNACSKDSIVFRVHGVAGIEIVI